MATVALAKVLGLMLDTYREYETLAGEKNRALVAADFAGLDGFSSRERALTDRLRQLEKERQYELADLFQPEEAVTLKELAMQLGETPEGRLLSGLREELLAVTDTIRTLDARNLQIIEKSLDIVDRTLKTVAGIARESGDTYNTRGFEDSSKGEGAPFSLLDVSV